MDTDEDLTVLTGLTALDCGDISSITSGALLRLTSLGVLRTAKSMHHGLARALGRLPHLTALRVNLSVDASALIPLAPQLRTLQLQGHGDLLASRELFHSLTALENLALDPYLSQGSLEHICVVTSLTRLDIYTYPRPPFDWRRLTRLRSFVCRENPRNPEILVPAHTAIFYVACWG